MRERDLQTKFDWIARRLQFGTGEGTTGGGSEPDSVLVNEAKAVLMQRGDTDHERMMEATHRRHGQVATARWVDDRLQWTTAQEPFQVWLGLELDANTILHCGMGRCTGPPGGNSEDSD